MQMQFNEYRWKVNPQEITITYERRWKEQELPFSGSVLQDLGRKKRIISGKGCFSGKDSLDQFRELARVFEKGERGYLSLPGLEPFTAVFCSLKLQAQGRPGETHYSFLFLEEDEPKIPAERAEVSCKEGDSLWKIAGETGIPLEDWMYQNSIPWINDLPEGMRLTAKEAG